MAAAYGLKITESALFLTAQAAFQRFRPNDSEVSLSADGGHGPG